MYFLFIFKEPNIWEAIFKEKLDEIYVGKTRAKL